VIPHFSFLYLC